MNHRKPLRLKNYDCSVPGMYFITICTHHRELYFQKFEILKNIVEQEWFELPKRFLNVRMDEFIVMPNHVHGIIEIVGAGFTPAHNDKAAARAAPTIGQIIGLYKSLCMHRWLKYISDHHLNIRGKFWQRNYYERVIRNDKELNYIREYIQDNPKNWDHDVENS